jgi:hypothetical protein
MSFERDTISGLIVDLSTIVTLNAPIKIKNLSNSVCSVSQERCSERSNAGENPAPTPAAGGGAGAFLIGIHRTHEKGDESGHNNRKGTQGGVVFVLYSFFWLYLAIR